MVPEDKVVRWVRYQVGDGSIGSVGSVPLRGGTIERVQWVRYQVGGRYGSIGSMGSVPRWGCTVVLVP